MDLQKNKVYRCQITDYTADGTGFAKIEGRAVFVPRTAVGDQCDVRIVKVTKNVAFGRVEKIIVPSAQRTAPACPVADKCGGCCYQHITYGEELRAKEKKVRDALTRIGGQDGAKLLGITGASTTEHYRNKAQYPVGRDKEGSIVTGFYRPRSHDIVPVEKCLIQSETADKIAAVVREWMTEFSVMPYDYEKKRGTIRHIYVRVGEKSGESQLTLISATKKMPKLDVLVERLRAAAPSLTGILLNHNQRDDNVILGNRTDVLWGEPMLEDRLCGHTFLLSPEAFYQVNHAQAERLYACAVDYAGLTGEETVLDLYCGAGTITLALAEHAKTAIGVEIVPEAIENAKRNALRNGMENTEFFCADAGQAAQRLAKRGIDVLVVDPPRSGLDEAMLAVILRSKIKKVSEQIYGAASVVYTTLADKKIKQIESLGISHYPICIAKTQYSFSSDPKAYGVAKNFELKVRDIIINNGAEMIVVIMGEIMRMPGLPKDPQAKRIDIVNGVIEGLS